MTAQLDGFSLQNVGDICMCIPNYAARLSIPYSESLIFSIPMVFALRNCFEFEAMFMKSLFINFDGAHEVFINV